MGRFKNLKVEEKAMAYFAGTFLTISIRGARFIEGQGVSGLERPVVRRGPGRVPIIA
jgi:hypothetical protein